MNTIRQIPPQVVQNYIGQALPLLDMGLKRMDAEDKYPMEWVIGEPYAVASLFGNEHHTLFKGVEPFLGHSALAINEIIVPAPVEHGLAHRGWPPWQKVLANELGGHSVSMLIGEH